MSCSFSNLGNVQLGALPYELCIGSLVCRLCIMFNICINYSTCQDNNASKTSRPVLVINPFEFCTNSLLWGSFFFIGIFASQLFMQRWPFQRKASEKLARAGLGWTWEAYVRSRPWRKAITLRAEFSFLSSLLDSGDTFPANHSRSSRTSIILEVVIIDLDDAYIAKILNRWSH